MHLLFNNLLDIRLTVNGYNYMLKQHLEYLKSFTSFLKRTMISNRPIPAQRLA